MLLVAELVLFGTGLYLAITGKAGSWIAGKGYTAEGGKVRLIGVILALPLPLAFCAGIAVGLIDSSMVGLVTIVEILMVLGSAIIAVFMLRSERKPVETNTPMTPPNVEPK